MNPIAFGPEGQRLFAADTWGGLRCWSAADGKKQAEPIHTEDLYCLAFHPDGRAVVAGDLKGVVTHWDSASGKAVRTFEARALYFFARLQDVGGVRRLAFDRAGATLACAGGQPKSGGFVQATPLIVCFDWQTGQRKHTLKFGTENDGYVYDLHFHPDGFVMAVTSGQPGQGKLFFQRPEDAQPFFLTPKIPNCHALAVHPNGTRLAVAATNANSAGNGRVLGKDKEYPGNFSPIYLWDLPKPPV